MPLMTNEQAEQLLGMLIRLLNPYTNTMYYPSGDPQAGFEVEGALAEGDRKALEERRRKALEEAREVFPQFQLEVDNRYGSENGGNYLSWEFKGQPQTVKKAVRIQFRHPDAEGVWITDHLLVGYAGSNGP
jgi:hypothetical protein